MAHIKVKQITKLLIFTLAVMALLLRPYMAYHLAQSQHLSRDRVALTSLLQRLVKKKDDHHTVNAGELFATQCIENKIPQLRCVQAAPHKNAIGAPILLLKQSARIAKVYHSTAYYKLFSTFRI